MIAINLTGTKYGDKKSRKKKNQTLLEDIPSNFYVLNQVVQSKKKKDGIPLISTILNLGYQ